MAAQAAVLLATAGHYGYHRDELYFRMLELAWGHVDQPPLTPLIAQGAIALFGDSLWAVRVPAVLCLAGTLWLAALITRELGGGRAAQTLCVWGLAFGGVALALGHTLATATIDLPLWTAVLLFAVKALGRDPRWWLTAGLVSGLALYNKHLIVLLLVSLVAGLLAVGPRRVLLSPWLWAGAVIALVVGAPNLVYQAANDWPQLAMASAIAEHKGTEARITLLPFQPLLLGLFLFPIWVAGTVALWRRPAWRPFRALAAAYPVMLLIVLATGGQMYYTLGLVVALYAAGCVAAVDRMRRERRAERRATLIWGTALNGAISAVIALPLLPVAAVGHTPLPAMNSTIPDQIGWPAYVEQIADVYQTLPADERERAIVLTANYGEAGAVDRFGHRHGLPEVYSGHNELHRYGPPPASADVVVAVGIPLEWLRPAFESCEAAAVLDHGLSVDNEEQGRPVAVCRGPVEDWERLWPRFQHYS
jgi:4-amino-4-deoxy-L-arabinose transferase-like glycosyltransferase